MCIYIYIYICIHTYIYYTVLIITTLAKYYKYKVNNQTATSNRGFDEAFGARRADPAPPGVGYAPPSWELFSIMRWRYAPVPRLRISSTAA